MTTLFDLPTQCPIYNDVNAITILSRDMLKQLRRLKRDLQACERCSQMDEGQCAFLQSFHTLVNSAVNAITEEWNLAPQG